MSMICSPVAQYLPVPRTVGSCSKPPLLQAASGTYLTSDQISAWRHGDVILQTNKRGRYVHIPVLILGYAMLLQ